MSAADVIAAAIALCVVIMLHEGGHYLTAIWSGMKVDRFSVFGIGPAILKLGTWRGTEFVIGAIPFGAYVLIRGMDAGEEPSDEPGSFNFRDKPLSRRALTIAGGPIANYIVAIVVFFAVFAIFGMKQPSGEVLIRDFGEASPAQAAGMEVGDVLVSVADVEIDPALLGKDVSPASTAHRGETIPVVVLRDGNAVELQVDIPADEEQRALSIDMDPYVRVPVDLGTSTSSALRQPFALSMLQLESFGMIFSGKISTSDVAGPVGMVGMIAEAVERGLPDFLEFAALISTMLGFFNLLPIPALDGGRLMFLAYEGIAKRRAPPRIEEAVHGYGMLVLLGLIFLVTIGDIRRLFSPMLKSLL